MLKLIEAYQAKKAEIAAKSRALLDKIRAENRIDLTEQEQKDHDGYMAEIKRLDATIARETEQAAIEASLKPAPNAGKDAEITGGAPRIEQDPKRGFTNIGEFARAVHAAARRGGSAMVDERLKFGAAPTTYANEAAGADGGFLIPPGFTPGVRGYMEGPDNFLALTDDIPVSGNSMSFPKDETVPWGTNGVRAYWEGEADQATQTKPVLGLITLRLRKLFALTPVSDELLADTTALSAYLPRKAGESIRFKANDAIINGDGIMKPLGIANSGALIVVSKTSGQSDLTVSATNVADMYHRMLPGSLGSAVWLVQHTVLPQLMLMSISNQPIWAPNFQVSPAGTLFGRPILITQSCNSLGTQGDIYFIDFKKYATIQKAIQSDTSIHLWFDYDVMAFRVIFRIDGTPWPDAAVSDLNGSSTTSPFVALEERAGS